MKTLAYSEELLVQECSECHISYGVPGGFNAARRADHRTWYCPSGHSQWYPGESTEKMLRRELAAAEGKAAAERARAKKAETARRKTEKQLASIHDRITNGVCPVPGCHRSGFTRVKQHVAAKHPDWLADHVHEIAT